MIPENNNLKNRLEKIEYCLSGYRSKTSKTSLVESLYENRLLYPDTPFGIIHNLKGRLLDLNFSIKTFDSKVDNNNFNAKLQVLLNSAKKCEVAFEEGYMRLIEHTQDYFKIED